MNFMCQEYKLPEMRSIEVIRSYLVGMQQEEILTRRGDTPTEACEGEKLAAELARGPQSASMRVALQSRCWPGTHSRDLLAGAASFLRPGLLERPVSQPTSDRV